MIYCLYLEINFQIMVITFIKHLLTDTLILNEKEVCPGCGCVCPCECTDCEECSPCKDH